MENVKKQQKGWDQRKALGRIWDRTLIRRGHALGMPRAAWQERCSIEQGMSHVTHWKRQGTESPAGCRQPCAWNRRKRGSAHNLNSYSTRYITRDTWSAKCTVISANKDNTSMQQQRTLWANRNKVKKHLQAHDCTTALSSQRQKMATLPSHVQQTQECRKNDIKPHKSSIGFPGDGALPSALYVTIAYLYCESTCNHTNRL